jgi:uncharacterized repeat protein (TIGR03803 family)
MAGPGRAQIYGGVQMKKFKVSTPLFLAVAFLVAIAISSSAQTLTTLHNFTGADGQGPAASMILARDGNYYGTTFLGGSQQGGVIFRTTPSGGFSVFYNFCSQPRCADGSAPLAGVVQGSDGNFYGAAGNGGTGASGDGTSFKVASNGALTVLHNFCTSPSCGDGAGPESTPIQATDGNFYGTTIYAGLGLGGVVYKVSPGGTFSVLFGSDPAHGELLNGVIQGSDGNFYVTASQQGANGAGTIFRVTPGGSATVLYNFCSQSGCADGSDPSAALVQGSDGNFYGTTLHGGTSNAGIVFKITPSGALTVLHNFDSNDGSGPTAQLIQGADGNFYGTTYVGGASGAGVIFGMTPAGSYTLLHSFAGSDGKNPQGGLVQAPDGSFYGTTAAGGSNNMGTIFHLTIPLVPTTTVLTSSPNPSYQGQNVTLTATVTAQNGSTPAGTVIFQSNGTQIGSASLNTSGVAVLDFTGLAVGSDNLTAVYQASPPLEGSTSNTVVQVVHPDSTTTVTSTPNPSTVGQSVTATATIGPSGPPLPTGTVSFTSNGTAISGCSNVTLSNSLTALCTSSSLPTGTDMIVATYSGDANYGPSQGTVVQIVNPVPTAVKFVTLPPCRVVDTRIANGTFGGPAIPGHSSRSFPLSEGDNPCGIPANAIAYSLNVTVVTGGHLGYLTIWPSGEGQPVSSTMNSPDGRTKANAAIIPAGSPSGSVSVYVTDTTNVILDINGYFTTSGSSTLEFYPLTPCRLVDTRGPDGNLGGPSLQAREERDFAVLEGSCELPNTAAAYSMNFTVLPKGSRVGYLTVWPVGETQPTVSTLNDPTGTNVANAALVPAGTNGAIATYVTDNTDLLIDVDGYFAPAGSGGLSFYALTPCRVLDTRSGGGQPFQGEHTVNVVDSGCAPPSAAQAFVFNATVVPPGALGYLTLWPNGQNQPVVSTLNAADGAITSNMAIVPNVNGSIDAYASALTQLILDLSGYFAP